MYYQTWGRNWYGVQWWSTKSERLGDASSNFESQWCIHATVINYIYIQVKLNEYLSKPMIITTHIYKSSSDVATWHSIHSLFDLKSGILWPWKPKKTPLQRTNMRPRLVIRKEGKQQKTAKIVSATQIGHRSCSRIKHDAIESDGSTDEPMGKLFSSRPFAALDGIFSFIMLFATWHRSSEMKLPSVWHIVGTNILTT